MRKNHYILPIAGIVCAISVVAMILVLALGGKGEAPVFEPPPFDSHAVAGMPQVDDPSWQELFQEGMSFTAWLCGSIAVKDGAADVYFTNAAENSVWLKLRITDENGQLLGETGLIKPGEYVQAVSFSTVPRAGQKIKLKLMSYEPDTYYSMGAVTLHTAVSG